MQEGLLSIIVPVYNVEQYIEECLDSLLSSAYKNVEIILIDDGSKDESGTICEKYALKDARIKVIHKANAGVSEARNDGLKAAQGTYISFADPDDVVLPNIYEKMIATLEAYHVDACCCSYYNLIRNKLETSAPRAIQCTGTDIMKTMASERYYTTSVWNKLFKREAIIHNGEFIRFDNQYTVGEDEKWLFEVVRNQKLTMQFISEPLYYWRRREQSASSLDGQGITRQMQDCIRVHEDLMEEARSIGDGELQELFRQELYDANNAIAKKCFRQKDNVNFNTYYTKIRSCKGRKENSVIGNIKKMIWKVLMEARYIRLKMRKS